MGKGKELTPEQLKIVEATKRKGLGLESENPSSNKVTETPSVKGGKVFKVTDKSAKEVEDPEKVARINLANETQKLGSSFNPNAPEQDNGSGDALLGIIDTIKSGDTEKIQRLNDDINAYYKRLGASGSPNPQTGGGTVVDFSAENQKKYNKALDDFTKKLNDVKGMTDEEIDKDVDDLMKWVGDKYKNVEPNAIPLSYFGIMKKKDNELKSDIKRLQDEIAAENDPDKKAKLEKELSDKKNEKKDLFHQKLYFITDSIGSQLVNYTRPGAMGGPGVKGQSALSDAMKKLMDEGLDRYNKKLSGELSDEMDTIKGGKDFKERMRNALRELWADKQLQPKLQSLSYEQKVQLADMVADYLKRTNAERVGGSFLGGQLLNILTSPSEGKNTAGKISSGIGSVLGTAAKVMIK